MIKQHKNKFFTGLLLCISITLLLPQTASAGSLKIGQECTDSSQCVTNECEGSTVKKTGDTGYKKYCVCDTGKDCSVQYSGAEGDWNCKNGASATFDLNYCLREKNKAPHKTENIKAPIGFTSASLMDALLDPGAAGTATVNEIKKIIEAPQVQINIPGLSFTDPKSITSIKEGDDEILYIPFLGQYLAAIYRYSVAVASVIAVIMLIVAGAQWTLSAGSQERVGAAKKRIAGAVTGLILAVGSYTLLYTINPDLVQFRSLRLTALTGQTLEDLGLIDEEAYRDYAPSSVEITSRTFNPKDPENFCFPVGDGYAYITNNWGGARTDKALKKDTICHPAVDIITKGKQKRGTVISMTDGKIIKVSKGFTSCRDGATDKTSSGEREKVGRIDVYDSLRNFTYVYGEINLSDVSKFKVGQTVKKGQKLGIASKCVMLHLEIYTGRGRNKGKAMLYTGAKHGQTTKVTLKRKAWLLFDELNLPPLKTRRNACAKEPYLGILKATGSQLLDPRQFLKQIKNNKC